MDDLARGLDRFGKRLDLVSGVPVRPRSSVAWLDVVEQDATACDKITLAGWDLRPCWRLKRAVDVQSCRVPYA